VPFAALSGSNTGLAEPQSMALDGAGNVYIPNPSSESLMVYAPLANQTGAVNAAPFATLDGNLTGLLDPRGIALDSNGKIFVGEHTQILVFPALGASTGTLNEAPLATISGSNTDLGLATGITLDSNNNLFVTDEARSSVFMYSALGSSTGTLNEAPSALISTTATTGLGEAEGIALDSTGKIYVASFGNFPNVVPGSSNLASLYVYPAGSNANSAPLAEISGAATGLSIPEGIAIDSQNKIYVADLNAQVLVYPALGSNSGLRNEAPIATITEVQRLVRSMRIAMPWLEDSDGPAYRAWAQMEILADTAFAVLQQLFIVGKNGEPRRLLTDFGQLRQARLAYERVLGMTPAARVAIQANGSRAPVDLAAAFARAEDAEVVGGSTEGDE